MGRPKGQRYLRRMIKSYNRHQHSLKDRFRKYGSYLLTPKYSHLSDLYRILPLTATWDEGMTTYGNFVIDESNAMPIQGEDPRMNKGVGVEPNLQEP